MKKTKVRKIRLIRSGQKMYDYLTSNFPKLKSQSAFEIASECEKNWGFITR